MADIFHMVTNLFFSSPVFFLSILESFSHKKPVFLVLFPGKFVNDHVRPRELFRYGAQVGNARCFLYGDKLIFFLLQLFWSIPESFSQKNQPVFFVRTKLCNLFREPSSSAFVTLACANLFVGIITTVTTFVLENFDDEELKAIGSVLKVQYSGGPKCTCRLLLNRKIRDVKKGKQFFFNC
jgi:hypothetical protein